MRQGFAKGFEHSSALGILDKWFNICNEDWVDQSGGYMVSGENISNITAKGWSIGMQQKVPGNQSMYEDAISCTHQSAGLIETDRVD